MRFENGEKQRRPGGLPSVYGSGMYTKQLEREFFSEVLPVVYFRNQQSVGAASRLTVEGMLDNIFVYRVYDSTEQVQMHTLLCRVVPVLL